MIGGDVCETTGGAVVVFAVKKGFAVVFKWWGEVV